MSITTPKILLKLTRMIYNEHINFMVINKTLRNIYLSRPLFSLVDNGVKMNFERCSFHSQVKSIFVHFCNQLHCNSKCFLVTQKGPK